MMPSWSQQDHDTLIADVRAGRTNKEIAAKLCKTQGVVEKYRRALVAAGILERTISGPHPVAITLAEAETLAALVRAGKRNHEIANELGLSEQSVERRLKRLGIRRGKDVVPNLKAPPRTISPRMRLSPWRTEAGGVLARTLEAVE
jgi:DNA-binding CsgD family transcriptional regulator